MQSEITILLQNTLTFLQGVIPTIMAQHRQKDIIHAQLRNKCSNLEGDLHSNYIKRSADCQQCRTNSKEDARHYFLACPKYINLRDKLKDEFAHNNFDFDMNVILKGDITKNYDQNRIITLAVQTYIFETERF